MRFFIKQVNVIVVGPLMNVLETPPVPITTAVVTSKLYTPAGDVISLSEITLDHVADGVYQKKMPALNVDANDPNYQIEVEAVYGGETVFWSKQSITSAINGAP